MRFLTLYFILLVLSLTGCASAPLISPLPPQAHNGIYHRVEKGETLWRISQAYDLDLDQLAAQNHIQDATNIEVGQLIFIPERKKQVAILVSSGNQDFIWPVKGSVIGAFNQTFENMANRGINIRPYADTNVVVSRSGRVVFSSPNFRRFGKTVIIEHHDGFITVYARNTEILAKVGDNVCQGDIIARLNTASNGRNNYLHFEIRKGHIPKNPLFYLP